MTALSGVWAATLTPLADDLAPDPVRLVAHIERLVSEGCDGVVLFGTTGEATSFSVPERCALLEALITAGVPSAQLIVGVGCAAAVDTVELARDASRHDVAGVLMLPPFYYKDVSDDDLFGAYAWIFEQAEPDLAPVLLYNIPQVSGIRLSADLAGRLASETGVVKGLKDSTGDLESLRGFLKAMPNASVFAGTELLLVPDEGAVGTISAAANVNAGHIRKAFETRDPADIPILAEAREALAGQAVIPALKAIVADRLEDPGWAAVRPPLRALSPESGRALATALPTR